jgi:hypothetical protein
MSLGKKMKCPKCVAVFVASAATPMVAEAVVAAPGDEDELLMFAKAETNDAPKPRKSKMPPPVDDEEPNRPVPTCMDPPKQYPSRLLVNLAVFFLLSLFLGFFAVVFLFMDEASMIDPAVTNRKYLEGFGWPAKATTPKDGGGPAPGMMRPKGRKRDAEKNKVIAEIRWRGEPSRVSGRVNRQKSTRHNPIVASRPRAALPASLRTAARPASV